MTPLETLDLVKLLGRMFVSLPGLFRRPYWSRKSIEARRREVLRFIERALLRRHGQRLDRANARARNHNHDKDEERP